MPGWHDDYAVSRELGAYDGFALPSAEHFLRWPKTAPEAPDTRATFLAAGKKEWQRQAYLLSFRAFLHLCSIAQKLATWAHLAARGSGVLFSDDYFPSQNQLFY